ncbi:glycogen debranching protein GlgX [Streptomyces sp. MS06]|uniref:glycogen debranching protein GlgX n=1 Tax=Streptomyces sp. MS06 TaxID=3385974 RepID=UPI0039A269DE
MTQRRTEDVPDCPPTVVDAVTRGRPQPLGATPDADGVNFSVYSEQATRVDLLLFDHCDDREPSRMITLDREQNRSFHFWHCHVSGLRPGQVYAYRMDGPQHTRHSGTRFNHRKVLLDPYARANTNTRWDRVHAIGPEDNCAYSMRSMVVDLESYDWEGDEPLRRPLAETVIYEVHVGGLTASPTSGCTHPGTFSGLVDRIPYLQQLGITAVELLPVFDFDDRQVLRNGPDGAPLPNYWGYDPFGFFAPHSGYCATPHLATHIDEFRDMVKALHRAGIEVILDVVFNHTSEGNEHGPTISFRGQANEVYYHLWPQDRRYYMDFTGCGNAINANHPAVAKFIIECLEYWVTEHHVDGFRFDLASELSRGAEGYEMDVPPVLWGIELSSVLSETKIIAEPWDGGGLYQVGHFPGTRWSQWNGPFRDDVRRFVRGDGGLVGAVASRIGGSRDLFDKDDQLPVNSINFVTCHDGFTLNDLVSYDHKHNHANGEANSDGAHENYSWNCGVEGPSDAYDIERLRVRQIKNHAAILLLSRGVPMILAGDEFRNSQSGNNNAYCQANELSWLDWDQAEKESEVRLFFQNMIELRRRHRALHDAAFFAGRRNERGLPEVTWHGTRLEQPGWEDYEARVLSYTLAGFDGEPDLHVVLNMFHLGLDFELPVLDGRRWVRTVDTSRGEGEDVLFDGAPAAGTAYHAHGRSVVVLTSVPTGGAHR